MEGSLHAKTVSRCKYYVELYKSTKKANNVIKSMIKEYANTVDCILVSDEVDFYKRLNSLETFLSFVDKVYYNYEHSDNQEQEGHDKIIFLLCFISFIHISYGYYEAFVDCLQGDHFRDTYNRFYDISIDISDAELSLKDRNMVLHYLTGFNQFIKSKEQLRDEIGRGKASFLSGSKLGSRYNCFKLDKRAKDRNDATRFVNQLMKELKDGTIKIKLDCDDISYYEHIQKNKLGTMLVDEGKSKITVLGSGVYGTALNICIDEPTCKKNYAVKYAVYNYRNDPDEHYDSLCASLNVEVLVHRFLNENIVYTGISPHIVLYLENALCTDVELVSKEVKSGSVMITAMETCIGDLETMYLKKEFAREGHDNDDVMLIMLFQVVYTLAAIQNFFPNFRHNDLHLANIFVQKSDPSKKFYYYVIDGNTYKIPNTGFSARIADFGLSNITGVIDNILFNNFEYCDKYGYRNTKNHYFDIHHVFSVLLLYSDYYKTSPKIEKLAKKIVPDKYLVRRLQQDVEYTTAKKCLKAHFSQFKVKTIPKKTDNISIFGIEREIKKAQRK